MFFSFKIPSTSDLSHSLANVTLGMSRPILWFASIDLSDMFYLFSEPVVEEVEDLEAPPEEAGEDEAPAEEEQVKTSAIKKFHTWYEQSRQDIFAISDLRNNFHFWNIPDVYLLVTFLIWRHACDKIISCQLLAWLFYPFRLHKTICYILMNILQRVH